jgi:hypothetical protein
VEHWSFDLMYEDSFLERDARVDDDRRKITTTATMTVEGNTV